MDEFTRARSPEQKKQRMKEIMDAADLLFRGHSYHEITLTTIAETLGWSRGNLYKYVTTKEEIFLELYAAKHIAYIEAMEAAFADKGKLPDELFAKLWTDVLDKNQEYLKYHGILSTIIETNVSVERLADFKKKIVTDLGRLHRILALQRPDLTPKQIGSLYLTLLYHGSGLYGHVHCGPLLRQALELAGLPAIKDEFAPMYREFLMMCLGWYGGESMSAETEGPV